MSLPRGRTLRTHVATLDRQGADSKRTLDRMRVLASPPMPKRTIQRDRYAIGKSPGCMLTKRGGLTILSRRAPPYIDYWEGRCG